MSKATSHEQSLVADDLKLSHAVGALRSLTHVCALDPAHAIKLAQSFCQVVKLVLVHAQRTLLIASCP